MQEINYASQFLNIKKILFKLLHDPLSYFLFNNFMLI